MKVLSLRYCDNDYQLRYIFIPDTKQDLIKIDLRGTALSEIAGGILEIRKTHRIHEQIIWPDRIRMPEDFKSTMNAAIKPIMDAVHLDRGVEI